jgi:hypothetical protein
VTVAKPGSDDRERRDEAFVTKKEVLPSLPPDIEHQERRGV